jgi:chromosome segregation ATPase
MSQYMKEISGLRKKININDMEIDRQLFAIGKNCVHLKEDEVSTTPLKETWDSVKKLEKEIPEKTKTIQQIKKAEEQCEELDVQIGALKHTIAEKEKESKPVYEQIGKIAYEVYKSKGETYSGYQHLFVDLIKLDEKCREYNRVKIQDDNEEKGILIHLFDAAKTFYINQKYNFLIMRYPVLYREVGKQIIGSDYIQNAAYPELDEVITRLKEKEEELKKLAEELEQRKSKKAEILEKLASSGIKGKLHIRAQEIEKEIKRIQQSIEELQQTLGSLFVVHTLNDKISKPAIEACLEHIYRLKGDNIKYESEIKKLEILIDIDKLEQKIKKLEKRKGQIEEEVEKQKTEIENLEKVEAQLQKEKKALQKKLEKKEIGTEMKETHTATPPG